MHQGKQPSIEELQIASQYASLRDVLMEDDFRTHRQRPLAFWALPTDRRLPLAFLGRTLGDLLDNSFEELAATPGIGEKKILSFLVLLRRALDTGPDELPALDQTSCPGRRVVLATPQEASQEFDADRVSEIVWKRWQASIAEHGLGNETFGRLARTLRGVTRVIWTAPLRDYTSISLTELRAKKTHGEKRIRAILEVFHAMHELVGSMQRQEHLVLRIVPRMIDQAETWIARTMQRRGIPTAAQIRQSLITPLLEQIRIDASQQIVQLAENRLGISGPVTSVRQAAREAGLTRARVYQLLNEINDIMSVRWPSGRHQVYELRDKFEREAAESSTPPDLAQFYAALELFYPGSRRGAADHIDPAGQRAPHPASDEASDTPRVGDTMERQRGIAS